MLRTKSKKTVITTALLSLMMVFAMMPGMAFATSVVEGYDISIVNPGSLTTADNPQLQVNVTKPAGVETHEEWSSANTAVATIGKSKGTLSIKGAGTVTINVELRSGKGTGGTGTGGGDGSGSTESSGNLLAEASITLNITKAAYGFQGLGGNGLMMTEPEGITVLAEDTLNEKTRYNNKIDSTISADGGMVYFGYTMSAGINNFKESTFNTYKDDINIYSVETGEKVTGIAFDEFENRTVYITASAGSLQSGKQYILRFGPSVCGNNASKNLDCYIDFTFTYQAQAAK